MRLSPLVVCLPIALLAGCAKGPPCSGISNADPLPVCLSVPAADYKAATATKYQEGGQMQVSGATPEKGSFLIAWYNDYDYALKTMNYSRKNGKTVESGSMPGGKGEWFYYDSGTLRTVLSVVKYDKGAITCVGNVGTGNAAVAKAVVEGCKTIR